MHTLLNLDAINELCTKHNSIFLIKKHFFHSKELSLTSGEYSNIFELTNENIKAQELIDAADILISDYSSVYIDYLLLDRPEIFYSYDLQDYLSTDRDMYTPYIQEYIPGRICETKEALEHELDSVLSGVDNYSSQRKKIRDYFYSSSNQSSVSAKQIDTILQKNRE